jgi:DNA-binding LacI/PurR family transcriptional regulator
MPTNPSEKSPLYKNIVEDLRGKIESGELAPGDKAPSTRRLCGLYGVSTITALAAIRELIASGHLQSRPRSGVYVRSPESPRVETAVDEAIAFLLPGKDSPFYAGLVRGAEAECRSAGYRLVVAHFNGEARADGELLRELAGRVGGLLILPTCEEGEERLYAPLLHQTTPFVFLDSYFPNLPAPCVTSDNLAIGYEATRHLLDRLGENGRVYALSAQSRPTSFTDRLEGFRRAVRGAGSGIGSIDGLVRHSPLDHEPGGYMVTREIIGEELTAGHPKPFGLFALNDAIARGCYVALQEAGLRIPRDALVAGCDDTFAIYYDPPLTCMHQEIEDMGRTGARLLTQALRAGRAPAPTVHSIPAGLMVRASTSHRSALVLPPEIARAVAAAGLGPQEPRGL